MAHTSDDILTAITNGSDPRTFTYDNAGRTTAITRGSNVIAFTYDEEGRITQITKPGMTTNTYAYNGLNTRVSKVDSLGTRAFKRDGSGVTDAVLNDGSNAYTAGISQRAGSSTSFQLDDYLGTTGRLLDSSQNVTDTFSYDAFGIQTARTGTTERPFGFVGAHGYQEDGDTGFKLLGHRYYDPSTGRFLTRDPLKDGRNWYAYCDNNPLSRVDPTGLFSIDSIRANWQLAVTLLRDMGAFGGSGLTNLLNAPPAVAALYRQLQSMLGRLGISLTPHTFGRILERMDLSSFLDLLSRGNTWVSSGGRFFMYDPRSGMIAIFNSSGRLMSVISGTSEQGQRLRSGARVIAKDDFLSGIMKTDPSKFRSKLNELIKLANGD